MKTSVESSVPQITVSKKRKGEIIDLILEDSGEIETQPTYPQLEVFDESSVGRKAKKPKVEVTEILTAEEENNDEEEDKDIKKRKLNIVTQEDKDTKEFNNKG